MRTSYEHWIWLIAFFAISPMQAQWVDHFDDICGLSSWADIQQTEGWNIQVLENCDISLTNPGFLTLMPYTVTWFADYRGPLLYKLVNGDFVLTGKLIVTNRDGDDIPGSAFSLGGLMVRNPKTLTNGAAGWVPNQEDYVFLSVGRASSGHPSCPGCPAPHFEVKTTNNSNSTLNISSINSTEVEIRMVMLHPYVLVLYKFPNESWAVHRRYFRSDLQDTVQVGMVTYTDWNKVSTYSMPFHNSHVLNEDLNPDPSSNPGLPFSPDIITRYDYLDWQSTSMPAAWVGLDLTNENQVSDAAILAIYGDAVADPLPTSNHIWLGGFDEQWDNMMNWLPAVVPALNDTLRINSCSCPEAHGLILPSGTTDIAGITIQEGAIVTIPADATLNIDGPFINEGTLIVFGQLVIHPALNTSASNLGMLDCRAGGVIQIRE